MVAIHEVMGYRYCYHDAFSQGAGFVGIAVALLGRNHPIGVILAALLFGALNRGSLFLDLHFASKSLELFPLRSITTHYQTYVRLTTERLCECPQQDINPLPWCKQGYCQEREWTDGTGLGWQSEEVDINKVGNDLCFFPRQILIQRICQAVAYSNYSFRFAQGFSNVWFLPR